MEQLFFLGTCAADFSPKLKNEYANCFDKDARRASCALLDGTFLIDCGPHCMDSLRIANIDPAQITHIFFTHLHSDHFNPDNVQTIASTRATVSTEPLHIWVREDADFPMLTNIKLHRMKLYQTYAVTETLSITSVETNHTKEVYPQWLLLEQNRNKLLYATDGSWIINETYAFLRNTKINTLVIDATCGEDIKDDRMAGHNSIPMIRLLLPSLRHSNIITTQTQVVLTHLAPSLHKSHVETVKIVENDRMKVAFDGLTIEI